VAGFRLWRPAGLLAGWLCDPVLASQAADLLTGWWRIPQEALNARAQAGDRPGRDGL